MRKFFIFSILYLVISSFTVYNLSTPVYAADDPPATCKSDPKLGACPAGIADLQAMVSRIISFIVPFAFIAVTLMLVWAGIKFITSGGDAKAISSASHMVTWALLGVLFLIIAWLIIRLISSFTGVDLLNFCLGFSCG